MNSFSSLTLYSKVISLDDSFSGTSVRFMIGGSVSDALIVTNTSPVVLWLNKSFTSIVRYPSPGINGVVFVRFALVSFIFVILKYDELVDQRSEVRSYASSMCSIAVMSSFV